MKQSIILMGSCQKILKGSVSLVSKIT